MNINKDQLQTKICTILCADIQLVQKNDDLLMIETPFFFADGDPYQIYLRELPSGSLRMTDCGHTMMHLSYENDIDRFTEGSRGKVFQEILSEMDISEDNGEFYLDFSSDEIGTSLFRFGQAITKINDITFLNRLQVESTFYEDLYKSILKIIPEDKITKDYIYSNMSNAQDYPIDYRIEGKNDTPLFLFGIPNRDKARLATIILERLQRSNAEFENLLVFADQSNVRGGDFARLSNAGGEMVSSLDAVEDFRRKLKKRAA